MDGAALLTDEGDVVASEAAWELSAGDGCDGCDGCDGNIFARPGDVEGRS